MTQFNQTHGDRWYAIYGDNTDPLLHSLPQMIEQAKSVSIANTNFINEQTGEKKSSQVFGLNYPLGDDVDCLLLIVAETDGNQIVSFYPHCKNGLKLTLTIQKIIKWDNDIEAYIVATDENEREYQFFDTLFFINKDKYQIGQSYSFSLSALSLNSELLTETTFELTGVQAKSFLEKIGKTSDEPIKFDMSNTVAFFQFDEKFPDFAEFQSPIKNLKEYQIDNQAFYRLDILINEELKDKNFAMPLYVKKDTINLFDPNSPIRGILCLQGHCIA